jgi:acetyl esterase
MIGFPYHLLENETKMSMPASAKAAAVLTFTVATVAIAQLSVAASDSAPESVTGTQYKATSDMQTVLTTLKGLGGKPIETLTPAEARKQPTAADAVKAVLAAKGKDTDPTKLVPGVSSQDTTIPGPEGSLPVRVYTPSGSGPFPVVVYYHGGGWVIANKDVYDGGARGLSKAAKAVVVSVDYRLAPEAKFPAAWDDALAAYKYVSMNAAKMHGDPQKLALAGESAGGNLAVSTAVSALAAGLPAPKAIVAVYPVAQTGDMMTASYVDSANAKPLNKAMIGWFVDKLLAKPADKADPRLDLVHANLRGLPPVTIINAEIDPLRSDGDLLEQALTQADVKVDHKLYKGVTHEFFGTAAVVGEAKKAQEFAGDQLKAAFK